MSAEYMRDGAGVVHVMAPWSGGEFTWCDQPVVDACAENGDAFAERDSSGAGTRCGAPATCRACRKAADEARASLRGVRWSCGRGSIESSGRA